MQKNYPEEILSRVIDQLKEIRLEKGLSHERLAAKAGVTRPAISYLENRKRVPSILLCLKIAEALEVSLGDLIIKAES
jgi:transcriptional regulator with XRE-family HTH domain